MNGRITPLISEPRADAPRTRGPHLRAQVHTYWCRRSRTTHILLYRAGPLADRACHRDACSTRGSTTYRPNVPVAPVTNTVRSGTLTTTKSYPMAAADRGAAQAKRPTHSGVDRRRSAAPQDSSPQVSGSDLNRCVMCVGRTHVPLGTKRGRDPRPTTVRPRPDTTSSQVRDLQMEPPIGIEPMTYALRGRRRPAETPG